MPADLGSSMRFRPTALLDALVNHETFLLQIYSKKSDDHTYTHVAGRGPRKKTPEPEPKRPLKAEMNILFAAHLCQIRKSALWASICSAVIHTKRRKARAFRKILRLGHCCTHFPWRKPRYRRTSAPYQKALLEFCTQGSACAGEAAGRRVPPQQP